MSRLTTWAVIFSFFALYQTSPIDITTNHPSPAAIKFMRRFGYLEDVGADAENLYKEETVIEAIKAVQKFGRLNQTGIIDKETMALFSTPRCGVPDMVLGKRKKRYVIGSEGWRKKHITYFIGNWSPKLGDQRITENQLKKAFQLWSDYSGLRFSQGNDLNADIIIFFARGPHGDGYPMDGPGNILAHAFYPYEHDSFGGDIHFDEDEDWINGPGDGFDFFTVAVHEIGHSLGLAHSAEPNSLMFPYYKGFNENFQLGYDDILGVYQLYVSKPVQDEDNDLGRRDDDMNRNDSNEDEDTENEDVYEEEEEGEEHGRSEEYDSEEYREPGSEDRRDEIAGNDEIDFSREADSENRKDADEMPTVTPAPDICKGVYDSITSVRGEIFVFYKEWVWRFKDRGLLQTGYPVKFQQLFRFPQPVSKIDAAYERPSDNKILLFSGSTYWIFDGDKILTRTPISITNLTLPSRLEKLDAALVWGKNQRTYFFHNDQYWRFDDLKGKMDNGYPKEMSSWRGIPSPIKSAFQWTDSKTYFFVDNDFYRFNDEEVIADKQYPLPVLETWFSC